MASATKFYAVCTDIETGKPVYHQIKDMHKEIDYVCASASLPYFSRIEEFNLSVMDYMDSVALELVI